MDIAIKICSKNEVEDFYQLLHVFEAAFEMEGFKSPDKAYLSGLLNKANFLVFVAKHNDRVVGGLTVHVLDSYYVAKPVAYIYDVGVLADYQRKGIGKQLIASLTAYCKARGFEDAYVAAEADDLQAVNFYRTTPISSELPSIHFTYSFDEPDASDQT